MWNPRIEIGFAFLCLLILVYYLSIFSYLAMPSQYPNEDCISLWNCVKVNFDYTFKDQGGVGGYLKETTHKNDDFFMRFIYDNLFKFILCLIITSMIAGIIIDTFGSL